MGEHRHRIALRCVTIPHWRLRLIPRRYPLGSAGQFPGYKSCGLTKDTVLFRFPFPDKHFVHNVRFGSEKKGIQRPLIICFIRQSLILLQMAAQTFRMTEKYAASILTDDTVSRILLETFCWWIQQRYGGWKWINNHQARYHRRRSRDAPCPLHPSHLFRQPSRWYKRPSRSPPICAFSNQAPIMELHPSLVAPRMAVRTWRIYSR